MVSLLGNIVTKPLVVRYFSSGEAILELTLLVKRHWTDRQGKTQERSDYIPLAILGKQAELLSSAKAGQGLVIEGRLVPRRVKEGAWQIQVVVEHARSLGRATQTYWNRAQVWGFINNPIELKQTMNASSLACAELILSNAEQAPRLQANVWGVNAQQLAKQTDLQRQWIADGYLKQTGVKGQEKLHLEVSNYLFTND